MLKMFLSVSRIPFFFKLRFSYFSHLKNIILLLKKTNSAVLFILAWNRVKKTTNLRENKMCFFKIGFKQTKINHMYFHRWKINIRNIYKFWQNLFSDQVSAHKRRGERTVWIRTRTWIIRTKEMSSLSPQGFCEKQSDQ